MKIGLARQACMEKCLCENEYDDNNNNNNENWCH